ncbi:MAG: hypothetical protein LBV00_12755 [Propionibacteriaceae bacterium]|jgi:hypothetical protein|nr:hypothetical protein [Propionibacteriaceae bacterium]
MKLVNLTPHAFRLFDSSGGVLIDLAPEGQFARRGERVRSSPPLSDVDGGSGPLPVGLVEMDDIVTDLPSPQPGTVYIVSRLTALVIDDRDDVYFPMDEVRDDGGTIIGCRLLGQMSRRSAGGEG